MDYEERAAELERQLKLSDEGVSRLAQRCLELEQEAEACRAAHPQREMHIDSPALLQPVLYYDAGLGFSERDVLSAPDCIYDETTGAVTASFELPVGAHALRLDPGELACCVTGIALSDERLLLRAANGIELPSGSTLFLCEDPNFCIEGLSYYPAGMQLVVSYGYFPMEILADEPLFRALLDTVRYYQTTQQSEDKRLHRIIADQQKAVEELQAAVESLNGSVRELRQANEDLQTASRDSEAALEAIRSSSSWRLTAPLRGVLSLFRNS